MTTTTGDSNVAAAIKKQIEFYFGDGNFPNDKHLRGQASLDPNGYISLAHLCTFNKLKAMSTDLGVIASALEGSEVVELSEDKKNVRRSKPLPETDTSTQRSIYTKGWPLTTVLEEVEKFYEPFGKVLLVRMRKNKLTLAFKGTAIIEFDNEESAKKVLAEKPQPKDVALEYSPKEAWLQEKQEQKKAATEKRDARKKDKKADAEEEEEEKPIQRVSGCIVKVSNIGAGVDRHAVQAAFDKFGKVGYTDFQTGDTTAYVRFYEPENAKAAVEGHQKEKISLGGNEVETATLAGDEEQTYFNKMDEDRKRQAARGGGRGGRGSRGGRGMRGRGSRGRGMRGGRGGKRSRDDDAGGDEKRQKSDE